LSFYYVHSPPGEEVEKEPKVETGVEDAPEEEEVANKEEGPEPEDGFEYSEETITLARKIVVFLLG
jgi:hypothetical protein